MSVKICLLRNGETVIGNLKEVLDPEENKSLGYKIEHPYVIDYKYRKALKLEDSGVVGDTGNDAEYAFRAWGALSSDREFNFTYDFVEVIYNPHAAVEEAYNTIVNHWIEENSYSVTVEGSRAIKTTGIDLRTDLEVDEETEE
jgi:hypothetical protein